MRALNLQSHHEHGKGLYRAVTKKAISLTFKTERRRQTHRARHDPLRKALRLTGAGASGQPKSQTDPKELIKANRTPRHQRNSSDGERGSCHSARLRALRVSLTVAISTHRARTSSSIWAAVPQTPNPLQPSLPLAAVTPSRMQHSLAASTTNWLLILTTISIRWAFKVQVVSSFELHWHLMGIRS